MSTKRTIYLDHSATTPTDRRVVDAMLPFFSSTYASHDSQYTQGQAAKSALESSRETIARILHCQPNEICFTNGGSHSDNLALRTLVRNVSARNQHPHLITTATEHSAVMKTTQQLFEVFNTPYTLLQPDKSGFIHQQDFRAACLNGGNIASLMLANNEIGTIQSIGQLSMIAQETGVHFHTDAVQAAGQLDLNVENLGVDMLSISAHKFYGPKGVGVLYIRGGINEDDACELQPSTNLPAIVGMARALEIAYDERDHWTRHFSELRDMLIEGVLQNIPGVVLTGDRFQRLPSHASFIFENIDSEALIMHLDIAGIAASSASACKTGNPEPSEVLLALGYSPKEAMGSLRLTVGRQNTPNDIEYTISTLVNITGKLRKLRHRMVL